MKWFYRNSLRLCALLVLVAIITGGYFYLEEQKADARRADCQKLAMTEKELIGAEYLDYKLFHHDYSPKADACILAYIADGYTGLPEEEADFQWYRLVNLTSGAVIYSRDPEPGEETLATNEEFNALLLEYLPEAPLYK